MAGHDNHGGSDMGAAFTGLIGGAILVGAILYGIVIWTNGQFAGHGEAKAHSSVSTVSATLV
ncbi:MAG: hypothetical protein IBJ03_18685 [Gemmatimonadaceae bacterium]|nr:hypothetical protein [Gemmatimonadaceae bacterium]